MWQTSRKWFNKAVICSSANNDSLVSVFSVFFPFFPCPLYLIFIIGLKGNQFLTTERNLKQKRSLATNKNHEMQKISVCPAEFYKKWHCRYVSLMLLSFIVVLLGDGRGLCFAAVVAAVVAVGFAATRIIHRGKSCFLSWCRMLVELMQNLPRDKIRFLCRSHCREHVGKSHCRLTKK